MKEYAMFVDSRCGHSDCENADAYRMVGHCCSNCTASPILVMFTAGHGVGAVVCPRCHVNEVYVTRLANDDEIPSEFQESDTHLILGTTEERT